MVEPGMSSYQGRALIGGCRERVTSCSGFLGVKLLSRVLGQSPERVKGRAIALGEPTTTKTQCVVIVGYNKASLFLCPCTSSAFPPLLSLSTAFVRVMLNEALRLSFDNLLVCMRQIDFTFSDSPFLMFCRCCYFWCSVWERS